MAKTKTPVLLPVVLTKGDKSFNAHVRIESVTSSEDIERLRKMESNPVLTVTIIGKDGKKPVKAFVFAKAVAFGFVRGRAPAYLYGTNPLGYFRTGFAMMPR